MATSQSFQVDLTNCDREPIHTPGRIQPHGVLLVSDVNDGRITHCSANTAAVLGLAKLPVGEPVSAVLGEKVAHDLRNAAAKAGGSNLAGALLGVAIPGSTEVFDVTVHRHNGRTLIELEPTASSPKEAKTALDLTQSLVRRIGLENEVVAIAETGAKLVRALLGYDRVMVYRFLHNGAGKVIAESRRSDLISFLGQHFPASDIPVQARRLYLVNWTRAIADVNFAPVEVLPGPGTDASGEIDMSFAHLRSVSPIHCEYLRNMGVAASLSISVVIEGKLWGLIACHHDTPKRVSLPLRISAELFGQYFSLQVAIAERRAELLASSEARRRLDGIITSFNPGDSVAWGLQSRLRDIANLVPSDGAGLWLQGEWYGVGTEPSSGQIEGLITFLDDNAAGAIWSSHELAAVMGADAGFGTTIAGVMAIPLSSTTPDYLLFFRSEEAHNVSWAGEPKKTLVPSGDGYRLTPRGSFETWREEVRGRATPWTNAELAVGEAVQNLLRDVVLRYKEATVEERTRADRRRRLLNDELNHRVKNIISLVKSIALQTGTRAQTVAEYTAALEGRLRALAFAHDQSLGSEGGNLAALIEAEASLHRYGAAADRFTTDGPPVGLDNRAFSVMALLLHEMMTNAAKYGALSVPEGKLRITWYMSGAGDCILDWVETNGPRVAAPNSVGFGSTLIRNTIAYDLGGSVDLNFDPAGVKGRFVIPADHVRAADETETPAAVAQSGDRPLVGKDVLLVEDQALIAMDTEDMLRSLGAAKVRSAPNVAEAALAIATMAPDCAVLDLNLGGETSADIADQLLEKGVPFVFATGYRDTVMIPERYRDVPVVRKPITPQTLAEQLAVALARS